MDEEDPYGGPVTFHQTVRKDRQGQFLLLFFWLYQGTGREAFGRKGEKHSCLMPSAVG